jgi:hypothetical protein
MDAVLALPQAGRLRKQYALRLGVAAVAVAIGLELLGLGVYKVAEGAVLHEVRPSIQRLAELVALRIQASELARYRTDNPEILTYYTMRPDPAHPQQFLTLVDDHPRDNDDDGDERISEDESAWPPGRVYMPDNYPPMKQMLETGKPTSDAAFSLEFGYVSLTGYAPVLCDGKASGSFVGIDVTNAQLVRLQRQLGMLVGVAWIMVLALAAVLWAPGRQLQKAWAARDLVAPSRGRTRPLRPARHRTRARHLDAAAAP